MAKEAPAWTRRENLFLVPPGGWLLVATILSAVALGGGRPLWAQGVVTMGVALLWLIWPPVKRPEKPIIWMLALLAIVPLAAFFPLAWAGAPSWREALAPLSAITPSPFVTPQPWLVVSSWLLWLTGVALAAWCASQTWDHYNRETLARMFTGGMFGVAAFAVYAFLTGNQPELWTSQHGFGPFPNRNQWGSLLGFSGIMALALLHQSVRHQEKRAIVFWSLALALFTWSVVQNGSRGGLVVLVSGGFAYWMFFGLARKEYRYAAVAVSLVFVSFSLFSFGGGALLERFVQLRELGEEGLASDARVQFYRMTRNLVGDAPITGFGLGNFEFVFPFYNDYEPFFDRRPVHPESSWLWLASEAGLLSAAAMFIAVCFLVAFGFKARRSRATTVRSAGMACALVMVINAFFEVSGHRLGTLFPAIVLASLCLPPASDRLAPVVSRFVLRGIGVLLAVAGATWIAAGFGKVALPAIQGTSALQEAAGREHSAGNATEAIELLRQASRLRPLSNEIHWPLAAFLLEEKQYDAAWNEFRAANAVLPYLSWMIDTEGYFWIPVNPARAAYAWNQALRRTSPGRRAELYAKYLRLAKDTPILRSLLLRLYPDNPEFEFVRIQLAEASGVNRLPRLLEKTNNLSFAPDSMVEPVMRYMLQQNQTEWLDNIAMQNVRLKRLGWRVLAERASRENRPAEALDLHFQYGPRPALPAPISRSDLRSIERAAALAPMDIATAVAYYQALEAARRYDDAFWQLRRIMEFPNAPAYIWYLAARTANERGLHDEAWQFLRTYEEKSRQ